MNCGSNDLICMALAFCGLAQSLEVAPGGETSAVAIYNIDGEGIEKRFAKPLVLLAILAVARPRE
jgi:hypothetical protein